MTTKLLCSIKVIIIMRYRVSFAYFRLPLSICLG